ncbi:hypothetical protein BH11CYA1_BH11CYA1_23280 [soil metagenome]
MTNDSFYSHYPFFTPPPESAQDVQDCEEDARAQVRADVRAILAGMSLPKFDFVADRATSPIWYDRETGTISFGIVPPTSPVQPLVDVWALANHFGLPRAG